MNNEKTLPPLPASDEKSISANRFDSFYKVRTRDFWGANEIYSEPIKPFEDCDHKFISKPGGVECKKCSFGLLGVFEIRKGKLFFKGKKVGL